MATNRRKFHRISSAGVACNLRIRGMSLDLRLLDESIDGLRVGGLPASELQPFFRNEPVELEFSEGVIKGHLRNISRCHNNTFELGIQRESPALQHTPLTQKLVRHFVQYADTWICCELLQQSKVTSKIRLFGQKEFEVKREHVRLIDEGCRMEMLAKDDAWRSIAKLYQISGHKTGRWDLEGVLAYEFESPVSELSA